MPSHGILCSITDRRAYMNEPLYQKIYLALKNDIISGKYPPGAQLPTETQLAEQFQVSKITSKKAMNMLTEEGYLIRQKGRGTFVSENLHSLLLTDKLNEKALPKIGLIFTNADAHFGIPMVTAVADACLGKANLLFALTHDEEQAEETAIRQMIHADVDGLIVFPCTSRFLNHRLLQLVIDHYPLVFIDQNIPSIEQNSVGSNNTEAVKMGLRYILSHGHKNISLMMPGIYNNVLQERFNAAISFSAETGVHFDQDLWLPDLEFSADVMQEESHIKTIQRHLLAHPEITAIFAFHYPIAVAAKKAAENIGRKVGQDLSILCFDGPDTLEGNCFFTHIRQDEKAIGQAAAQLLLELIRQPKTTPRQLRFDARLVEGRSFFTLPD